jgi:hypothetical protein
MSASSSPPGPARSIWSSSPEPPSSEVSLVLTSGRLSTQDGSVERRFAGVPRWSGAERVWVARVSATASSQRTASNVSVQGGHGSLFAFKVPPAHMP